MKRIFETRSRSRGLCASLFFLGMIAASGAKAIDPDRPVSQLQIDIWGVADGLPQNSVHALLQTRDGYLWMGTQEGVVRFDGIRMKVYDRRTIPGLTSNLFAALAEDADGVVWAGGDGGLLRIDGDEIEILTTEDGLGANPIRSLWADPDGGLWIGAVSRGGLHRLVDGRLLRPHPDLVETAIWSLAVDEDDALWLGVGGRVGRLQGDRLKLYGPEDGLPETGDVHAVLPSRDGVFAGTDGGLLRLEGDRWTQIEAFREMSIYTLQEDSHGLIWVGARNHGLRRYDGVEAEEFVRFGRKTSGIIHSLIEGREGGLWIGTGGSGLWRLRDSLVVSYGIAENMDNEKVYAVFEDSEQTLWAGTFGGGLYAMPQGEGIRRHDFPSQYVWSFAEDADGALWVGTYGEGVFRLHGESRSRRERWSVEDGLSSDYIRAILPDRYGDVWIGSPSGLQRIDPRGDVLPAGEGVLNRSFYDLLETRDGVLWAATGSGVARREGEVFIPLTSPEAPDHTVYALQEDSAGSLWFGTLNGLYRLRGEEIVRFGVRDGLYDDLAYSVLEDDSGALWMSCNRGIYRVALSEVDAYLDGAVPRLVSSAYGTAEGMRSREANGGSQSAGWKRRDGKLVFPTTAGFVEVDPARVDVPRPIPNTVVEIVETEDSEGEPEIYEGDELRSLRLAPGVRRVSFRYTAPSFNAPRRIRFSHFLENYDADWSLEHDGRNVSYTRVPPGTYRFHVRARYDEEDWGASSIVSVTLEPFFVQTPLFRVLVGTAILALLFGIYRIRIRHLRRREVELRRHVDDAMARIKVLSGLLPICSGCKKIRDEGGSWNQLETYIDQRSEASFSHGFCPECVQEALKRHAAE